MRHSLHILMFILLLLSAMVGSCMLGATNLSPAELWHSTILWQLRLPRVLLSFVVGAILATCGTVYQSLFRNPLADPYLLGVASGASLGAALAIVGSLTLFGFGTSLGAFAGAIATIALIWHLSTHRSHHTNATLLLTGISITLLANAIVSFLLVMHHDKAERIIFWTMGSFAAASWSEVLTIAPIALAGIAILLIQSKNLNLLNSGGIMAQIMGVDVRRTERLLLFTTTIMTALSVAACGVVGFVGLIVPHGIRLIAGADNRHVMPLSALAGGLLLVVCDTLARTLFQPAELPVGSLTALIGAPLFILLILRNRTNI